MTTAAWLKLPRQAGTISEFIIFDIALFPHQFFPNRPSKSLTFPSNQWRRYNAETAPMARSLYVKLLSWP
jgi:hypothetical protein